MAAKKKENVYQRKILIDEPSSDDLFHGRGHKKTAVSLARAIREFADSDRAIGLDGPWGSGKSSIVEMAAACLSEEVSNNKKIKFHFFTFDIWKSQGASFRRSLLEGLVGWAKEEFPRCRVKLNDVEKDIRGKRREVDTNHQVSLDWYGVAVILLIPLLPLYYFWLRDAMQVEGFKFFESKQFAVLVAFFCVTFLRAFSIKIKQSSETGKDYTFLDAISRTLLLSARQYENKNITEYIREVDPNDFEFQLVFRRVLSIVQGKNSRVVLVLDNIDRLPADEIEEYWALVRSAFSRTSNVQNLNQHDQITAVVPYDRKHIAQDVYNASSGDSVNSDQNVASSVISRELFSKTFDEILSVSPPVMSDAKGFFEQKISESLPNFSDKEQLFRVFLIFDFTIRAGFGAPTPRQIISFINQVSGMFAMHEGVFPIATIAVFVCYQDLVEADPLMVDHVHRIPDRVVAICDDPDFQKNLAALQYNVEPELAFQVLLDQRIKEAAINSSPSDLLALSKSSGFDLRVTDVVRASASEWRSAGDLSAVVSNFAALLENQSDPASRLLVDTLAAAVEGVASLDIRTERYVGLLKIHHLCSVDLIERQVRSLVEAGADFLESHEISGEPASKYWSSFVQYLNVETSENLPRDRFLDAFSKISLPVDEAFLLGIAAAADSVGVPLSAYKTADLALENESTALEEMISTDPSVAYGVVSALHKASIIDKGRYSKIEESISSALQGEQDAASFAAYFSLIGIVLPKLDGESLKKSSLNAVFSSKAFYESFADCERSVDDWMSVPLAFYLAVLFFGADGPPMPIVLHPNGQRVSESTESYGLFKSYWSGEQKLSGKDAKCIADFVKRIRHSSKAIDFAKEQGNSMMVSVARSIFVHGTPPTLTFTGWLGRFDFLIEYCESDLSEALGLYAGKISDADIRNVSIEEIPVGLYAVALEATHASWKKFCSRVVELLSEVKASEWASLIRGGNHVAQILSEVIEITEMSIDEPEFRQGLQDVFLQVASAELEGLHSRINLDALMGGVEPGNLAEMQRITRERLRGVTPESLAMVYDVAPQYFGGVIESRERMSAEEKDNLIRFVLRPALEGGHKSVLSKFVAMGYSRVSKLMSGANESSRSAVGAALRKFESRTKDYSFKRSVVEVVRGKRSNASWYNFFSDFLSGNYRGD